MTKAQVFSLKQIDTAYNSDRITLWHLKCPSGLKNIPRVRDNSTTHTLDSITSKAQGPMVLKEELFFFRKTFFQQSWLTRIWLWVHRASGKRVNPNRIILAVRALLFAEVVKLLWMNNQWILLSRIFSYTQAMWADLTEHCSNGAHEHVKTAYRWMRG